MNIVSSLVRDHAMLIRGTSIILALAILLAGCGPRTSNFPYSQEPDPRKSEYVIGVADRLSIRVRDNNDLNTDIQVRPDGTVTMPLVGDLAADGLTPTELKMAIKRALEQYVKDAILTVAVTEVNSYKVTVSGNVNQPGVYTSRAFMTVGEAIALAGGPNRFAAPEQTVLVRKGKKGIRRIPIDYDSIMKGQAMEQNLVLKRDDELYIP